LAALIDTAKPEEQHPLPGITALPRDRFRITLVNPSNGGT
jgi:hypothetical protein